MPSKESSRGTERQGPSSPPPAGHEHAAGIRGAIVALSGRRIDPAGARPSRFPLASADVVGERIHAFLARHSPSALVSSAACGADLLALHAAGELGIRRYIVLPFDRRRFRETSVTDRPGGDDRWGPLFDHILDDVPEDDITTLGETGNGDGAYRATNACALQQAQTLADERGTRAAAIVVWEGAANGAGDLTASFVEAARDLGIDVYEILTR